MITAIERHTRKNIYTIYIGYKFLLLTLKNNFGLPRCERSSSYCLGVESENKTVRM